MPDPVQQVIAETAELSADLEVKRESFFRIYLMLAPMSFALICAIAAMNTDHGTFAWLPVLIFTLMAAVIEFQVINQLYRRKTKDAFLNRLAESLHLQYSKTGLFPLDDIAAHGILPPYDTHHIEDGFAGRINGVDLAFQEVVLSSRVRDHDNNKIRYETGFWGIVLRIRIGKVLNAHTVILPRRAMANFLRRQFTPFKPANMVSPAFEKRFEVMTTDQVEARYILDPAFMERVMAATDLLSTKDVEISFLGQEMVFAIEHFKPMFEIGALWTRLTPAQLQAVADELNLLTSLITILKLNPYTGLGATLPPKSADLEN